MDGINEILNSLSAEDIGRIKNLAGNLLSNNADDESQTKNQNQSKSQSNDSPSLDPEMLKNVMNIMSRLNSSSEKDYRANFIISLKPLLSEKRQTKADEAIKMIRLFDLLPLLKETGILQSLGLGGE